MAHANSLQHRGGLDFFALARGGERSYSTSFLVNLDPDLLSLCASAESSTYQLCLQALSGHTQRIFKMIKGKSKREINQVGGLLIAFERFVLEKKYFSSASGQPTFN